MDDLIRRTVRRLRGEYMDDEADAIEALQARIETLRYEVDAIPAIKAERDEALAKLEEPFKKLSDDEVLWLAQSHGIDAYACNALAFYADLISTTPAQPEPLTDTELINRGCRYETELMQVQTEPVELTDEQIADIAERFEAADPSARFWLDFARAVLAASKGGV